jgi:hypothetical protein
LFLCELLLELQSNKAFVGRRDPAKVLDQPFQRVEVMWSRRQQGEMQDHPAARKA